MKLTGGEIIARFLVNMGVEFVAGIPGHGCLALTDALYKMQGKLSPIQPRQEMSGVHIADGYFRTTGKPMAVFTSIGPGAINTAIGVGTCFVDSTPVMVFTGDTHTHMFGKGVLQEIERTHDSNF
ncbi:MAG: thiamine pyrophosphate-binding protein, partial [Planctomycetes bacterium]|nr:thiamine pyrophosphate-binding protein [Planctomycetota bacterium]